MNIDLNKTYLIDCYENDQLNNAQFYIQKSFMYQIFLNKIVTTPFEYIPFQDDLYFYLYDKTKYQDNISALSLNSTNAINNYYMQAYNAKDLNLVDGRLQDEDANKMIETLKSNGLEISDLNIETLHFLQGNLAISKEIEHYNQVSSLIGNIILLPVLNDNFKIEAVEMILQPIYNYFTSKNQLDLMMLKNINVYDLSALVVYLDQFENWYDFVNEYCLQPFLNDKLSPKVYLAPYLNLIDVKTIDENSKYDFIQVVEMLAQYIEKRTYLLNTRLQTKVEMN